MRVIGMAFVCLIRVRCISPKTFDWFSLNVTQIFLSVRRCAEPMTQLRRLKVKVNGQGHVFYPIFLYAPLYLLNPLTGFTRLHANVPLSDTMCRTQLLNFAPALYLLNPEWFSLNVTQIFLSVRRCAEPMTRLYRLEVRVCVQGHGFNT